MNEPRAEPSRRERQSAARATQILDAAAALFAERGFHRTTTRDIAEAADVAEGTLYNYFANKDELLIGIMQRLSASFSPALVPPDQASTNARERFASLLEIRKTFQEMNLTRMQAVLSEIMANAELRERFYQELVAPGLQALEKTLGLHASAGQIRPGDIPEKARLLASIFIGMFFLEVLGDPVASSKNHHYDEVSMSVILNGIAPENQGFSSKEVKRVGSPIAERDWKRED